MTQTPENLSFHPNLAKIVFICLERQDAECTIYHCAIDFTTKSFKAKQLLSFSAITEQMTLKALIQSLHLNSTQMKRLKPILRTYLVHTNNNSEKHIFFDELKATIVYSAYEPRPKVNSQRELCSNAHKIMEMIRYGN